MNKFSQRALGSATSCLLGAAALPAYCRPLYTYFLFFPRKHVSTEPFELRGVCKKDVSIQVEGGVLHGWFFKKADSPYVLLVNHGNGGNISSVVWIADNALRAGVSALVYDYRGYGLSAGKPSAESICADGLAAYDYLITEGYAPDHIIVYGQSLGCAVACHIVQQKPSAGLVLQSGFASLRTVAAQYFVGLKIAPRAILPDILDNSIILTHGHPPLLFMHGTRDRIVPCSNSIRLYSSAKGDDKELVLLSGAGHNLYPKYVEAHATALNSFIHKLITVSVPSPALQP